MEFSKEVFIATGIFSLLHFAEFVIGQSTCPTPHVPENGSIEGNPPEISYKCAEGYELVGSDSNVCEEGIWINSLPFCNDTAIEPFTRYPPMGMSGNSNKWRIAVGLFVFLIIVASLTVGGVIYWKRRKPQEKGESTVPLRKPDQVPCETTQLEDALLNYI